MTSDLDMYRSAKLLIDQHGDEAPIHAAMRADAMLDAGDMEGRAVWRRVVKVAKELLRTEPEGQVHQVPGLLHRLSLSPLAGVDNRAGGGDV